MPKPALLLLIKNPIPGKTKTRLAATVGNDMALKMYHVLCEWTREQAAGLTDVTRYLYYSSEIVADDTWPADQFHKRLQHPGGLGDRMEDAFRRAFADGHDRVIITGSDCPGIDTAYLRAAFAALDTSDVVIGPALDGGYTLLGMRYPTPELFHDVAWSTADVLPTTRARARDAGRSVHLLPPLSDVDHLEDWEAYGWPLPE